MGTANYVAIVTGANKGIGHATVKMLCERYPDWIVYLTARSVERGQEAIDELNKKFKLHPRFHQLDVTSVESIQQLADFFRVAHPEGINVLVNNAGVGAFTGLPRGEEWQQRIDRDFLRNVVETNYFGFANVCRELFPLLADGARVVNVSGGLGRVVYTQMAPGLQLRFRSCHSEEELSSLIRPFVELSAEELRRDGWITGNLLAQHGQIWGHSDLQVIGYGVAKLGMNILTAIQQKQFDQSTDKNGIIVNTCGPGMIKTEMNPIATRPPEDAAELLVYLATILQGETEFRGKFFNQNKQVDDLLTWKPKTN